MKRRIARVAAIALGASLLGVAGFVAGQDKATAVHAAPMGKGVFPDSKFVQQALKDYQLLVYKASQSCADADCNVTIDVAVVPTTVGGKTKNVCIARFPESLEFTNSDGGMKRAITWSFDPGNNIIKFHREHGILVVADGKSQIDVDKDWTSEVKYGATNKHDKKGTATYVPVILYQTEAGGAPSVCATGDPQIVNN